MTARYSPPPLRELPAERRRLLARHLLDELDRPARVAVTRRMIVAAAAVAVLSVVAGVLGTRGGTGTASAAEVRAKLAEGLQLDETISGEYSVRTRDPGPPPPGVRRSSDAPLATPVPSRFVIAPDGSYSSRAAASGPVSGLGDLAYDAATGVETWLIATGDRPTYLRSTNLDPALLGRYGPEAHFGAWVQAALAEADPRVKEVTLDGREAWELTATFSPGEHFYETYGVRVDVAVDRATGLVLQVVQYAYDTERWTSIARIRNLRIGESTSPSDFTLPKPRGARAVSHDYGFRRVPLSAAAAVIGYPPLLPANTLGLPLADFAVAKTSRLPFPGIPDRRDIASARYGRGAAIVTVSTYRGPLTDLTSILPGGNAETAHPTGGPFADGVAYVTTSPLSGGVFAAHADGLLVRITAPSAEDALAIAGSLRAAG